MGMSFEELVSVWYPQAVKIFKQTRANDISNLMRIFHGGHEP